MPTILINQIKIGRRARLQLGDVASLAESITTVGLLHPVVVTPDHRLIAGCRRIAAAKQLGWDKIPITVAHNVTEAKDMLLAERDENVQREDLNPVEAAAIRKALLPYLQAEAKLRADEGRKKGGGDRRSEKAKADRSPEISGKAKPARRAEARVEAAAGTGWSAGSLDKVDEIVAKAEAQPELFAEVIEKLAETNNVNAAVKAVAKIERQVAVVAAVAGVVNAPTESCDLRVCSMQELLGAHDHDLDAIVTDPPYPEEFLPLYGELAKLAAKALKPDGILAVMCGQSYLPRILADMSQHMEYRWIMAYLTPGGQAVQLWDRKVNTFWKPILLFGGKPNWTGDVVHSDVNDNDKRFHGWGQSESGMARLVEALTKPGDLVCDPFLGAGTTAVACLTRGRRIIGCDVEEACIETTRGRVALVMEGLK